MQEGSISWRYLSTLNVVSAKFTARTLHNMTLWRIDPLLRGYSLSNSRCYAAPAAYACVVTPHNNRIGDAGGVLCGSVPRLYDSTDRDLLTE
jgi:hypothetical protein